MFFIVPHFKVIFERSMSFSTWRRSSYLEPREPNLEPLSVRSTRLPLLVVRSTYSENSKGLNHNIESVAQHKYTKQQSSILAHVLFPSSI
jgi:hypothetical protein